MKFTVEVEEFYLEGGELATELKHQIKQDVVKQIHESVKKQVSEYVDAYVKKEIDAELNTRVKLLVDDFVKSGKVKGRYSSDSEKTIPEWIAENIREHKSALSDAIKSTVALQVKGLQDRYDLLFATQLITKIKEQGFLKDEAVKMLLTLEEETK
jgi:hypothetical protein